MSYGHENLLEFDKAMEQFADMFPKMTPKVIEDVLLGSSSYR